MTSTIPLTILWGKAKAVVPGFRRLTVSWHSDGSVSIEIWRIPVEEDVPWGSSEADMAYGEEERVYLRDWGRGGSWGEQTKDACRRLIGKLDEIRRE